MTYYLPLGYYTDNYGRKRFIPNRRNGISESQLRSNNDEPSDVIRVNYDEYYRSKIHEEFKKEKYSQTNPLEKGWKKNFYNYSSYSFTIVNKGNLDYYIQVKNYNRDLLSIPLKPLILRGVSGLLHMHGLPIDQEILSKATEMGITLYNQINGIS